MENNQYLYSLPLISLIVPCFNEEKYISRCLDSIIANNYPKDKIEILVIDGFSRDKTREIIKDYINKYSFIKLLDNPKIIQPTALNIGIKSAQGDIIIRLDAHSYIAPDFILKSLEYLSKIDAVCVGGPIETVGKGFIGKVIALVLSSAFGVGGSKFRTSKKAGYVDTIAFGAYRKEIFSKIGFFDENLTRSEDNDFNYRVRKAGGKIFMTPDIKVYYQAPGTLKKLLKQAFNNGWWNVKTLFLEKKACLSWRHFIPFFFTTGILLSAILIIWIPFLKSILIFILILYVILACLGSILVIKQKRGELYYIPLLPLLFFIYHFIYGLGSLMFLLKLAFKRKKEI